ncbi:hypothetical protein HK101_001696 [Irineochytrium annulatum]|nr:hypothetical protein HK101_001696 [Irineochytrium annulatum]
MAPSPFMPTSMSDASPTTASASPTNTLFTPPPALLSTATPSKLPPVALGLVSAFGALAVIVITVVVAALFGAFKPRGGGGEGRREMREQEQAPISFYAMPYQPPPLAGAPGGDGNAGGGAGGATAAAGAGPASPVSPGLAAAYGREVEYGYGKGSAAGPSVTTSGMTAAPSYSGISTGLIAPLRDTRPGGSASSSFGGEDATPAASYYGGYSQVPGEDEPR